jgi:hypothetical protein
MAVTSNRSRPSHKVLAALAIHNDVTFRFDATNQCAVDEAESLRIDHCRQNRVEYVGYNSSFDVSHLEFL